MVSCVLRGLERFHLSFGFAFLLRGVWLTESALFVAIIHMLNWLMENSALSRESYGTSE